MSKKIIAITVILCFTLSSAFFLFSMKENTAPQGGSASLMMAEFCIAQIYPVKEEKATVHEERNQVPEVTATAVKKDTKKKNADKKVDNSKPQVIIYHTHSSESYQPYTESNFHREEEKGTVREVGNVMTEELNRQGIAVVHDKTVHDRPSYNESYTRSLETVTSLMKKYPTAEIIIDLHRDAAAYTGNVGETIDIKGDTAAKYKLVVGQNNDNYSQLMDFANKVNDTAEKLYPGFSGRIIEKEYRYNEYISDKYLLLEVGNNQNDIKEVCNTGKYFAHVIAEILEEE